MATQHEKYNMMFGRFLLFAADAVHKYPELSSLLEPLTAVSSFSVFMLFYQSDENSQELIRACRNPCEEHQTIQVDRIIGEMLVKFELDPEKFDAKDRVRLCKYLRLFSDVAINGI